MSFSYKKRRIKKFRAYKRALLEKITPNQLFAVEKSIEHPMFKITCIQEQYGIFNKPHSLEEIKTIIGYNGNDKTLKQIIIMLFSEYKDKRVGKPNKEMQMQDPMRGRRKKLYVFNPGKKQKIKEFAREYAQEYLPFKVHEILKAYSDSIDKYVETLPEKERQKYHEAEAKAKEWLRKEEEQFNLLPKEKQKQLLKQHNKFLNSRISDLIT